MAVGEGGAGAGAGGGCSGGDVKSARPNWNSAPVVVFNRRSLDSGEVNSGHGKKEEQQEQERE